MVLVMRLADAIAFCFDRKDDGTLKTVLIDEGVYNEKVVVGRISPTTFVGITSEPKDSSSNQVMIQQHSYVNQSDPNDHQNNCDAVVLGVGTGSPIGSSDFKAYNIDFVQRQYQNGKEITQYQFGPAAALCVQNSNASFYGCEFSSYQDTLFVGTGAQAFFFKSVVRGMTDYLYGSGKAWFEQVRLLNRACGGAITAWRGDASDSMVGVYVSNSAIDTAEDASTLKSMTGKCYLGRPWNVQSHSVYLNTSMSDIVANAGFRIWSQSDPRFQKGETRFAEYGSSGPGGNLSGRNTQLETILSQSQASAITYNSVFGGDCSWIDSTAVRNW